LDHSQVRAIAIVIVMLVTNTINARWIANIYILCTVLTYKLDYVLLYDCLWKSRVEMMMMMMRSVFLKWQWCAALPAARSPHPNISVTAAGHSLLRWNMRRDENEDDMRW